MADHAAFLRAILDRPDDVLPREIYADFLDEQGDPRGEFIRTQIALVASGMCECGNRGFVAGAWKHEVCRLCHLRLRERELLQNRQREWGEGVPLGWTIGNLHTRRMPDDEVAWFARGFVESVHCRSWKFMRCAAELFTKQPVLRVCFAGANPAFRCALPTDRCRWIRSTDRGAPDLVPPAIYDLLKDGEPQWRRPGTRLYNNFAAAIDDLNQACVAWGRSLVPDEHGGLLVPDKFAPALMKMLFGDGSEPPAGIITARLPSPQPSVP